MAIKAVIYALLLGGGLIGGVAWRELVALTENALRDQYAIRQAGELEQLRAQVQRLQTQKDGLRTPPPDMDDTPGTGRLLPPMDGDDPSLLDPTEHHRPHQLWA